MPSGNVANLTGYAVGSVAEGNGFQVMPTPLGINHTDSTDTLYSIRLDLVGAPANSLADPWPISNAVAAECALWVCVQAYDPQVADTKQTQITTHSFSQIANSTIIDNGDAIQFLDPPAATNPRPNVTYAVACADSSEAFGVFLHPLFNGTVFINEVSNSPSSNAIQVIWTATSTDLDVWMKNIALSMTNTLRAFDPAPDDMSNGTGYQLGIQVRWLWITLPAVLVISSLIILLVTVVKTARSHVQAWKGSPLALLFVDVDQNIRRGAEGHMDTSTGLGDSVGKTKVMVTSDQNGKWGFKLHDD